MVLSRVEAPQQFKAAKSSLIFPRVDEPLIRRLLGIGIIALASGTAEPAIAADSDPFYVAGAVTGSALEKPKQTIANAPMPGATLQVVNDVDFGWGGQAEIGYAYKFLRIEAEIGRTSNHSDHYSAISPIAITLTQSGKNTITRYMANGYVDLPLKHWPVQPYLGIGLGAAEAHVTTFAAPARAPNARPSQILDFKDTKFASQLMGGLSVPVSPRFALSAQYRWFDGGTFRGVDSRGERATRTLHGSNVDIGARFRF
jgi:opacity protein-like surface antigen